MKRCKAVTAAGKRCKNRAHESDYCNIAGHNAAGESPLTDKERTFIREYCVDYNKSAAARRAGYSEHSAGTTGYNLMEKRQIRREVEKYMAREAMSANEAIKRMTDWGRGSFSPFHVEDEIWGGYRVDLSTPQARENLHLIKKIRTNEHGIVVEIELHDAMSAVDKILKVHGKYIDHVQLEDVTPREWDPENGDPAEYVQQKILDGK